MLPEVTLISAEAVVLLLHRSSVLTQAQIFLFFHISGTEGGGAIKLRMFLLFVLANIVLLQAASFFEVDNIGLRLATAIYVLRLAVFISVHQ